ncbi:MAG TPA: hypothetical protein ENI12_00545 [Nitrospirae bacterium]|nr:hypothetical protein [Nitrospirota bacterium]
MARRGGMYKSEKRRKELKRKKKQDEKLLKRQKKVEGELLDEEAPGIMEATDATESMDTPGEPGEENPPGDDAGVESTDEEAVSAED